MLQQNVPVVLKVKRVEYSSLWNFTSPLQEITYHMGSHSVTCNPAEVTFPALMSWCLDVVCVSEVQVCACGVKVKCIIKTVEHCRVLLEELASFFNGVVVCGFLIIRSKFQFFVLGPRCDSNAKNTVAGTDGWFFLLLRVLTRGIFQARLECLSVPNEMWQYEAELLRCDHYRGHCQWNVSYYIATSRCPQGRIHVPNLVPCLSWWCLDREPRCARKCNSAVDFSFRFQFWHVSTTV